MWIDVDVDKTFLILEDLSVWPGLGFAAPAPFADELGAGSGSRFDGELVFNTAMTGYHEVLTDPSYTGQIVLMTYPEMGNYGCDERWSEGGPGAVSVQGMVVRCLHGGAVPGGRRSLEDFLGGHAVCGISGVDTRALTVRLRRAGSCNAVIVRSRGDGVSGRETEGLAGAGPGSDELECVREYLAAMPSMDGRNMVDDAGVDEVQVVNEGGSPEVVLLDCGSKKSIVDCLVERGAKVWVMPPGAEAGAVMETGADAVLFSNGPGDPMPLKGQIELAAGLVGRVPLWGICLGHQVLCSALGGRTYKMAFGHHGVNHPVRDEVTGAVFVTSQNHGFAVDEESLPAGCEVRFRNANDGSVEGVVNREKAVMCVQYHPEAAPGPVDSRWIFDEFFGMLG